MKRYVEQLLEDIEAARLAAPSPWLALDREEDDDVGIEAIHFAPTRSLEQWTGISQLALPPAERLSADQLSSLLEALKQMLSAYQCHVVFQQTDVPERLQYRVLRRRFHQHIPLVQAQELFFSFCDPGQDRSTCLLGAYCECQSFDRFLEASQSQPPDAFPFPPGEEGEAPDAYLRGKYGEDVLNDPTADDDCLDEWTDKDREEDDDDRPS